MQKFIYDSSGSIVREIHVNETNNPYDPFAGGFILNTVQDVDPVLREVQYERDRLGEQKGSDFKLAAKIPLYVIEQAMREGWLNDREAWKRWLNNSDNRAFRVTEGRV